eukprot:2665846-Karenia_brevis.AAC.1
MATPSIHRLQSQVGPWAYRRSSHPARTPVFVSPCARSWNVLVIVMASPVCPSCLMPTWITPGCGTSHLSMGLFSPARILWR